MSVIDILRTLRLDNEQTLYVNSIRAAASNMCLICNDVLDLRKMELGKLQIERIQFNLNHFMHEVKTEQEVVVSAKGVSFICNWTELSSSACRVLGDPNRIKQVRLNIDVPHGFSKAIGSIINTSLKHTVTGVITLRGSLDTDEVFHFVVTDTGKHYAYEFDTLTSFVRRRIYV